MHGLRSVPPWFSATTDKALVPAGRVAGKLVVGRRVEASEFTILMRGALKAAGIPDEEAKEYTSHSCKATVLSWAAKSGMPLGGRRLLGGHAKQGARTPLEYSRDALAGPLLRLASMYEAIRVGDFMPDSTRSGRWRKRHAGSAS